MSYLKRYYEKCHGCAVGDLPHPDGLLEEADAEIAKLRKELDEANEAVIAAQMLGFEKGKDAAKAELAEAREHIRNLVGPADYASKVAGRAFRAMMDDDDIAREEASGKKIAEAVKAARAFLAAKETQG